MCWRLQIVKKVDSQSNYMLSLRVYVSPKNGERNAIVAAIRCEMSDSVLYLIFGSEHRQDYSINLIVCHKSLGYGRVCVVCVRSHFAGLFLLSLVTSISTHRRRQWQRGPAMCSFIQYFFCLAFALFGSFLFVCFWAIQIVDGIQAKWIKMFIVADCITEIAHKD